MKVKFVIRLPDETQYTMVMSDLKEELTDALIEKTVEGLANLFSSASYVHVKVVPDNVGTTKEEILILYGETLKNSYIIVKKLA